MFFSFIISPLIINRTLYRLGIDKFPAFFISLAIALLAPQFVKINGGHYALAYGCVIPLSILLIFDFLNRQSSANFFKLFFFNVLLFLLHPYLGFCASVFTFIALLLFELIYFKKQSFVKNLGLAITSGLVPLILFKLFMALTDHHENRTIEPYGGDVMIENIDSMVAPVFGPFQHIMERFFNNRTQHFEGHTYLGFSMVILTLIFVVTVPFVFKKLRLKKEMLVIFVASLFLLFLAF